MVRRLSLQFAIIVAIICIAHFINLMLCPQSASHPPLVIDERFVHTVANTEVDHLPLLHLFYNSTMLRVYDWKGDIIHYDNAIMADTESGLKFFVSVGNNTTEDRYYTLMLIVNGQTQSFYVDFGKTQMEVFRFELQKYHLLNIPVKMPITPEMISQSGGILRIILLRFPEERLNRYVPYFSQGLQVRIDLAKLYMQEEPHSVRFFDLKTSPATIDQGQYRIVNNGAPLPSLFGAKVGTTHTLQLLMRPGDGVFRTIVLLNDRPISILGGKSSVLWKSEVDHTYMLEFEITIPEIPGDYNLYALSFDESNVLEPGATHERTTLLHTLRVIGESQPPISGGTGAYIYSR